MTDIDLRLLGNEATISISGILFQLGWYYEKNHLALLIYWDVGSNHNF